VGLGHAAEAEVRLSLSQDKLMQLAMGYRSARDLLSAEDVRVSGAVSSGKETLLPVLEVLFPKGLPFVWTADHF